MAKLKFDRIVNITLGRDEKSAVPIDEVWKGILGWHDNLYLNNIEVASGSQNNRVASNVILGGGVKLNYGSAGQYSHQISFTGVAFKVVKE